MIFPAFPTRESTANERLCVFDPSAVIQVYLVSGELAIPAYAPKLEDNWHIYSMILPTLQAPLTGGWPPMEMC